MSIWPRFVEVSWRSHIVRHNAHLLQNMYGNGSLCNEKQVEESATTIAGELSLLSGKRVESKNATSALKTSERVLHAVTTYVICHQAVKKWVANKVHTVAKATDNRTSRASFLSKRSPLSRNRYLAKANCTHHSMKWLTMRRPLLTHKPKLLYSAQRLI